LPSHRNFHFGLPDADEYTPSRHLLVRRLQFLGLEPSSPNKARFSPSRKSKNGDFCLFQRIPSWSDALQIGINETKTFVQFTNQIQDTLMWGTAWPIIENVAKYEQALTVVRDDMKFLKRRG